MAGRFVLFSGAYMHITYTLHCSTRRIVEIATTSRPEHRVAQTREVACTIKIVLPQVGFASCVLHVFH